MEGHKRVDSSCVIVHQQRFRAQTLSVCVCVCVCCPMITHNNRLHSKHKCMKTQDNHTQAGELSLSSVTHKMFTVTVTTGHSLQKLTSTNQKHQCFHQRNFTVDVQDLIWDLSINLHLFIQVYESYRERLIQDQKFYRVYLLLYLLYVCIYVLLYVCIYYPYYYKVVIYLLF